MGFPHKIDHLLEILIISGKFEQNRAYASSHSPTTNGYIASRHLTWIRYEVAERQAPISTLSPCAVAPFSGHESQQFSSFLLVFPQFYSLLLMTKSDENLSCSSVLLDSPRFSSSCSRLTYIPSQKFWSRCVRRSENGGGGGSRIFALSQKVNFPIMLFAALFISAPLRIERHFHVPYSWGLVAVWHGYNNSRMSRSARIDIAARNPGVLLQERRATVLAIEQIPLRTFCSKGVLTWVLTPKRIILRGLSVALEMDALTRQIDRVVNLDS